MALLVRLWSLAVSRDGRITDFSTSRLVSMIASADAAERLHGVGPGVAVAAGTAGPWPDRPRLGRRHRPLGLKAKAPTPSAPSPDPTGHPSLRNTTPSGSEHGRLFDTSDQSNLDVSSDGTRLVWADRLGMTAWDAGVPAALKGPASEARFISRQPARTARSLL